MNYEISECTSVEDTVYEFNSTADFIRLRPVNRYCIWDTEDGIQYTEDQINSCYIGSQELSLDVYHVQCMALINSSWNTISDFLNKKAPFGLLIKAKYD